MAGVRFERVRKLFDGVGVFDGFDLEVRDGEFLVVVGPSGCGKSTLLRLLAGLEELDSGTISIGGRSVERVAPRDRDIAMVFQSYALYPHMSVRRNLGFGLEMRGTAKEEIARRVGEAARQLELEPLLERRPAQLSGGQRQRVALGRAIVRQPAVFLFDEPLSNLDAALRVQMRAEIAALHRRLGTTTLYVTHDQVEAMTMGERVAILDRGRLQQLATPREIYESPANLFVARFIGSPPMNLFAAKVAAGGALEVAGVALALGGSVAGALAALAPGRPLLAGFRPEAGRLGAAASALSIGVDFVEQLGHETLAHGKLASTGEPVALRFPARQAPAPGDRVTIEVEPDRWHLFEPASGVRIAGS
jgi:multiple sugar transport system ATP-binding protein